MAVKVKVLQGKGGFRGPNTNVSDYTIQEASTPTIPGDTTGGVGSLSFGTVAGPKSPLLSGNQVRLEDERYGYMDSYVSSFDEENSTRLTVETNNRLALLTVSRTALPFSGTLTELFEYYFALCDVVDGYVIDPSFDAIQVAYRGGYVEVWNTLKEICIPYGAEITLVSGNIYVRPVRTITAQNYKDSAISKATSVAELASTVEVYYYNNEYVENGIVYAPSETESGLSIDTSAQETFSISTNVSLSELQQPSAMDEELWHGSPDSPGYVVYGINGPVDPLTWAREGGLVSVSIDPEDDTKVDVYIRGASGTDGPYRIIVPMANPDVDGDADGEVADAPERSSLRLAGTGVRFDRQLLTMQTGADPRYVTEDRAVTVDNRAISTKLQAYDMGARIAGSVGGPQQTIRVSTVGINRRGESNSGRYLTMAEFNVEFEAVEDFDDFNALPLDWEVFDDFNAYFEEKFAADFETQAFGNVAGARVRVGNTFYRIRTATITPSGIDYNAERDTMMEDFNSIAEVETFDEFNSASPDALTFDEFNALDTTY